LTAHEMEREEVTKTDEWKEFHDILIEKGDIPEQLLPLLPALEVIFELKKCINFLKKVQTLLSPTVIRSLEKPDG